MATSKHRQPPSTCVTDTRHHLDCSTFTHSAGFQPRHCPGLAGAAKGFAALTKNHSSLQQWQCLSRAEPRGHRTTESWNPTMVWTGRAPKDNLTYCTSPSSKPSTEYQSPWAQISESRWWSLVPSIVCTGPLQDESHKQKSPWLDFPPPLYSSLSLFCCGRLVWVFPCSGGTQSSWMCNPDSLGAAPAPAQPWSSSPHIHSPVNASAGWPGHRLFPDVSANHLPSLVSFWLCLPGKGHLQTPSSPSLSQKIIICPLQFTSGCNLAGKLEVWRQLFFFLWRNGLYSFSYFSVIYFRWSTGGKKGKENKMGLDFMIGLTRCFDILAGLIIQIYAIHASNSTREERAVTGVSQLLHPGIHVPTKTTIMANP